jgi:hypothetical protein
VGGAEPTAGGPAIAEAGADAALAKEAAPYVAPARSKTYVDIKNAIEAAPPLPEWIKAP